MFYTKTMKKQSLSDRILSYYKKRAGEKISGGEIERLVAQNTSYKASNASRRLRELHQDDKLKRDEIKGTVVYWYAGEIIKTQSYQIEMRDGQPVAVVV